MNGLTIETIDLWLSDCQCQRFNSGQPRAKAVSGRKLQNDWQQTQPLATLGSALTRTVFCEPQKSFTGTILVCFFCVGITGILMLNHIWSYSVVPHLIFLSQRSNVQKNHLSHIDNVLWFLIVIFYWTQFSQYSHESSNPCFYESDENNVTWFYTPCFIF